MSTDLAHKCASELIKLRDLGVRRISFTGGEPILASRQLHILSESAAKAGIECTIVTSGYWAFSQDAAADVVKSFPEISIWHLSTDMYHQEFVPLSYIQNASREILYHGGKVVIRMTVSEPPSKEEEKIFEITRSLLPIEIPIDVQPIIKVGRASSLKIGGELAEVPAWPCIPSGMMVQHDGTISPCCSCLVTINSSHPFNFGNVGSQELVRIYEAWLSDPLLQLMRAVGFLPLLQWAYEAFPNDDIFLNLSRNPCKCCIKLFNNQKISEELKKQAEKPEIRAKILNLTEYIFGDI